MLPAPLLIALTLAPQQQPAAAPAAAVPGPSPAVRATNGLGIALYKALDEEQKGKNLFVSPFSITVALAMLAEGARDETLAELKHALQLPPNTPLTDLHADLQTLLERYRDGGSNADPTLRERSTALRKRLDAVNAEIKRKQGDPLSKELVEDIHQLLSAVDRFELRVASALWVERTHPLVRAFVRTLDESYGTGSVNALDIVADPEAARLRINGWVAEQTERRIQDLIPPGVITELTRLVLANAVFFRGEWADPFDANYTRDDDFLLAGGDRVSSRLMYDSSRASVPYAAFHGDGSVFATPLQVPSEEAKRPPTYPGDDGFTMIELPYRGGELAMLAIAPRSPNGLPRLESLLDAASLASWVGHLQPRKVDTAMLSFEQRGTCELSRALKAVGVRRAFNLDRAQFGGITADPDPMKALFLADVHHRACLKVHEKGTEAAAATLGRYGSRFGVGGKMIPFTPVFRADRPFLFLIRDTKSGAILFLGRMVDPRA
jgi:serine protease inhibitor